MDAGEWIPLLMLHGTSQLEEVVISPAIATLFHLCWKKKLLFFETSNLSVCIHFVAYLSEHFHVEKCKECPAVVRLSSKSADGSAGESQGPGMIHVDDSLLLLPLDWALKCFIPVIQQRFQITYEVAHEPGDSFRFLKSLHSITDQGITIRQPSSYIQQMQTIMNVKQSSRQRVPCWPELRSKDNTPELSIEEASRFR